MTLDYAIGLIVTAGLLVYLHVRAAPAGEVLT